MMAGLNQSGQQAVDEPGSRTRQAGQRPKVDTHAHKPRENRNAPSRTCPSLPRHCREAAKKKQSKQTSQRAGAKHARFRKHLDVRVMRSLAIEVVSEASPNAARISSTAKL